MKSSSLFFVSYHEYNCLFTFSFPQTLRRYSWAIKPWLIISRWWWNFPLTPSACWLRYCFMTRGLDCNSISCENILSVLLFRFPSVEIIFAIFALLYYPRHFKFSNHKLQPTSPLIVSCSLIKSLSAFGARYMYLLTSETWKKCVVRRRLFLHWYHGQAPSFGSHV